MLTIRWIRRLVPAVLASQLAWGAAYEPQTLLVRSVYATAIPENPRELWDRVDDLYKLNRREDADLLTKYIERSVLQEIAGQNFQRPTSLQELIDAERTSPPKTYNLIHSVFGMLQGTPDPSSDDSVMSTSRLPDVHYRYAGHSVWSRVSDPQTPLVRLNVVNGTHRRIEGFAGFLKISTATEDITIKCSPWAISPGILMPDESTPTVCGTNEAIFATRGPPLRKSLPTADLLHMIQQVEEGRASMAFTATNIYFPDDNIILGSGGPMPRPNRSHSRTLPELGTVTCQDRNTCSEERTRGIEKSLGVLATPQMIVLALLAAGVFMGYRLPVALGTSLGIIGLGGGIAIFVLLAFARSGGGWDGLLQFIVGLLGASIGAGLLLGSIVAYQRERRGLEPEQPR